MALRIDASGDSLTRTTNLPTITACTLMGWFMIVVDRNDYSSMLRYRFDSTKNYNVGTTDTGTLLESFNQTTGVTGTNLTAGQWAHIAMTISGSSGANFLTYVNGVLDITNNSVSATTASALMIGNDTDHAEWMNGRVAAVKIWSAVLTVGQIATEMRYYRPIWTAGLNTWLPCIHPTVASNALDWSGNGFNLTAGGTLTIEDGPPIAWAPRRRMQPTLQDAAPVGRTTRNIRSHPLGLNVGMALGIGGAA